MKDNRAFILGIKQFEIPDSWDEGATILRIVGYLFTGQQYVTSSKSWAFSSTALSTSDIVGSCWRNAPVPVNECELDNFLLTLSRFKLQISLFWDIWCAVSYFLYADSYGFVLPFPVRCFVEVRFIFLVELWKRIYSWMSGDYVDPFQMVSVRIQTS